MGLAALVRRHLDREEDEGTAALTRALRPARRRGYLTRGEFEAACRWKSPRAVHHVRANSPRAVRTATGAALRARGERERLLALTALRGVSVPTASALLTLLDPRRYGVIDIRVWQLLHRLGAVDTNPRGVGLACENWLRFLEVIRGLASSLRLGARDVERTLFAVHRRHQRGTLYVSRRGGAP
jgi:hypothetical protein